MWTRNRQMRQMVDWRTRFVGVGDKSAEAKIEFEGVCFSYDPRIG